MRLPKLRWLYFLAGLAILGSGILGFILVLGYTVYAFTDSHAPYGLHIPLLGLALLGAGILGGGALLLLANLDRRVERLEAAMATQKAGN